MLSASHEPSFVLDDEKSYPSGKAGQDRCTTNILHLFDPQMDDSPLIESRVGSCSNVSLDPASAVGNSQCSSLPAYASRFLDWDVCRQERRAQHLDRVMKLEAECSSLERELSRARGALVQQQVSFMEEMVVLEDFPAYFGWPSAGRTQGLTTYPQRQDYDAALSQFPSRNGTAASIARSIPKKRRFSELHDDNIAYGCKRRRYN